MPYQHIAYTIGIIIGENKRLKEGILDLLNTTYAIELKNQHALSLQLSKTFI